MHDATKVYLGNIPSSAKEVTCEVGDPEVLKAGYALRYDLDGSVTNVGTQEGDQNMPIGVSVGPSLSDTSKVAMARSGLKIPMRVRVAYATGQITITNVSNLVAGDDDEIEVAGVSFVAQAGAATPGSATFQASGSTADTAASLAAQINAHEDTAALVLATVDGAVVTVTALEPGEDGDSLTLLYTDNNTDPSATVGAEVTGSGNLEGGADSGDALEIGHRVSIDYQTGEVCDASDVWAELTAAVIASEVLTGVYPDGSTHPVVLVDMQGGF
jgi:hypothetical protein